MDAVEKIELTSCQKSALKILGPLFKKKSNSRIGILTGSAGTGKTYLTAYLINKLEDDGWNVVVLTPTGRAAQVMAEKMKPFGLDTYPQTMHSYMYKIKPIDYSANQLSIFGTVQTQTEENGTIFIIDEGSMVGNEKYEKSSSLSNSGMNFGSGSLLHDLIECADLVSRDDSRVLIVGDPCQLPPISKDKNSTPALSVDSIRDSIPEPLNKTEILSADLVEILRQGEGTLLDFVNLVRDSIKSGNDLPKKELEDVKNLKSDRLIDIYLEATSIGVKPEGAIVLAHTNRAVQKYNNIVRKALERSDHILATNEILLVKRNVTLQGGAQERGGDKEQEEKQEEKGLPSLKNGSFIQIVNTPYRLKDKVVNLRGDEVVILKFFKAEIKVLNTNQSFHVTILANSLIDEGLGLSKEQRIRKENNIEVAILVDFQKRMLSQHNWKPAKPSDSNYDSYSNAAFSDKYMNALRVKYGYAVTVHNAQGGEWPVVIVDTESNHTRKLQHVESKRLSFARWIYTASTRASEKLYFLKG